MKQFIFIVLLIAKSAWALFAQVSGSGKSVLGLQEKVILSTDRTLYFSGEIIFFKVNRILSGFNNDTLFSTVLYLELYDKNNNPIVQKKEQIINGISCGGIEIPTDLITGNYFLRVYTQYMRNFKPELFFTNQITIINPEVPSKEAILAVKNENDTLSNPDNGLEIITSKEIFSPRSLITIGLKGQGYSDVSVSVIKKGSYEEKSVGINNHFKSISGTDTATDVKWYPEIRTVSISGKAIDKKTGQALKGVLVYASIINNGKQFHITRTKENGEFVFPLPNLNESNKIYICAQTQTDKEAVILINRDFSPDFPKANYVQENLDSNKRNLINEMYINYQITKMYNKIEINKSFLDTLPDPFSEKYVNTILKDFVDLPEMLNVFNEIVPSTHVKKSGKEISIQIFDKKTRTTYAQPLILLDGIPFQNDSALLSLAPSKIVSVGVLAEPFVHGSEIIHGIMSIKSAEGNLAGLKLPKDLVVIDYVTLSPHTDQKFREYRNDTYSDKRNPDFRNTMYWNPSVTLNDGNTTLQFYASDHISDYDVVVRGIDEKEKLIFKTKTIRVDNSKQ